MAANNDGGDGFHAARRPEAKLGYGLPVFVGAFTGTPDIGFGPNGHRARLASRLVVDLRLAGRLRPRGQPRRNTERERQRRRSIGDRRGAGRELGVGGEDPERRRPRLADGFDACRHEPVAVPEREEADRETGTQEKGTRRRLTPSSSLGEKGRWSRRAAL